VMAPLPSSEGTMPYLIFISISFASFGSHLPTTLGAFYVISVLYFIN
jgi:hypothetical protein